MQLTYPSYYPEFQCIASACSDNCCIGWEIDIDRPTHACYMAQPGAFGKRLRSQISQEDPPHFLLQHERCPFLNEQNLCDIILTLGEDALCEICSQHPRFHEWFGGVKESGLGLCCEAATKLMLQQEQPATFLHTETHEPPVSDFVEEPLFRALLPARELLFALLQNRRYPIGQRLAAALLFACELQNGLDGEDPVRALQALTQACRNAPAFFFQAAQEAAIPPALEDECRQFSAVLSFFRSLEPIDETWPDQLQSLGDALPQLLRGRSEFLQAYQPRLYEYEHLAVYFVYRYLLKAVYDGEALPKVKLMVVSLLLLSVLDTDQWRKGHTLSLEEQVQITKNYSKEMEYCEENLQRFEEATWTEDFLSVENLLALLKKMGAW